MKIRHIAALLFILLGFTSSLFAGEALVQEVRGLAFFRDGESWSRITPGDVIAPGTRVFNSSGGSLVLEVNGDKVEVDPLSDFDLVSARNQQDASVMYVRSGGMRAQVVSSRAGEGGVRFQIQSPVATASVRGTVFRFNGVELEVEEGDVQLQNILGQRHSVRADQKSRAFGLENISSVERYLERNTTVE